MRTSPKTIRNKTFRVFSEWVRTGTRTGSFVASALIVLALSPAAMAAGLDSRLIGAWARSADDCTATFERRGGTFRFREPRDLLATTFIFSSGRVVGAGGSCRIGRIKSEAGRMSIGLHCQNAVGDGDRTIYVRIVNDRTIEYGAFADRTLDVTYEKCR
jgi:hypothetical protein